MKKEVLKDKGMHAGATADKFAYAKVLRDTQAPQEKKLWDFLRTKPKGLKFRRQHPFADYILDFYCHGARLVIEVDGNQHWQKLAYDHDRTKILEGYGLKVLRFENSEVDDNFENVKQKLLKYL